MFDNGAAPQFYGPDCLQRESQSQKVVHVEGKHSGRGLVVATCNSG